MPNNANTKLIVWRYREMKRILALAALLIGMSLSAFAQSGKITGKLTYPSDGIPLTMAVCVYPTAQKNGRSLSTAVGSSRFH